MPRLISPCKRRIPVRFFNPQRLALLFIIGLVLFWLPRTAALLARPVLGSRYTFFSAAIPRVTARKVPTTAGATRGIASSAALFSAVRA